MLCSSVEGCLRDIISTVSAARTESTTLHASFARLLSQVAVCLPLLREQKLSLVRRARAAAQDFPQQIKVLLDQLLRRIENLDSGSPVTRQDSPGHPAHGDASAEIFAEPMTPGTSTSLGERVDHARCDTQNGDRIAHTETSNASEAFSVPRMLFPTNSAPAGPASGLQHTSVPRLVWQPLYPFAWPPSLYGPEAGPPPQMPVFPQQLGSEAVRPPLMGLMHGFQSQSSAQQPLLCALPSDDPVAFEAYISRLASELAARKHHSQGFEQPSAEP